MLNDRECTECSSVMRLNCSSNVADRQWLIVASRHNKKLNFTSNSN